MTTREPKDNIYDVKPCITVLHRWCSMSVQYVREFLYFYSSFYHGGCFYLVSGSGNRCFAWIYCVVAGAPSSGCQMAGPKQSYGKNKISNVVRILKCNDRNENGDLFVS